MFLKRMFLIKPSPPSTWVLTWIPFSDMVMMEFSTTTFSTVEAATLNENPWLPWQNIFLTVTLFAITINYVFCSCNVKIITRIEHYAIVLIINFAVFNNNICAATDTKTIGVVTKLIVRSNTLKLFYITFLFIKCIEQTSSPSKLSIFQFLIVRFSDLPMLVQPIGQFFKLMPSKTELVAFILKNLGLVTLPQLPWPSHHNSPCPFSTESKH